MTYRKVLFICHANTSRSVIAEALLKKMLTERALHEHLAVESGGIASYARDGALVSMDARLVLRDEGIHVPADTVSTDLKRNRHLVADADLILAMTEEQVRMLRDAFPEAATKEVYTLKAFAGGHGDIEDPVGQGEDIYAACRDEIKGCLERVMARLAPPGLNQTACLVFQNPPDDVIREILGRPRRIAVVGCSPDPRRDSHRIARLLLEKGHTVVPVNPAAREVLGHIAYPSLRAVPGPIEVVDVFRRADQAGAIVDDAIAIAAHVVWLQLGVVDEDAAAARKPPV